MVILLQLYLYCDIILIGNHMTLPIIIKESWISLGIFLNGDNKILLFPSEFSKNNCVSYSHIFWEGHENMTKLPNFCLTILSKWFQIEFEISSNFSGLLRILGLYMLSSSLLFTKHPAAQKCLFLSWFYVFVFWSNFPTAKKWFINFLF